MANTFKIDTKSSCVTDAHTSTNANVLSAGGSATLVLLSILVSNKTGASADVDVLSTGSAGNAVSTLDAAISLISTRRGELGALSNRLSSTIANLDNIAVNLSSARGRIQDADFAAETSNLAKSQIMQQAATAMLAQANASKQTVLALIQ